MSSKFILNKAYINSFFDALQKGDLSFIDPNVRWVIGSETKDPVRLTGVYNLESWVNEVKTPLWSRLQNQAVAATATSIDIIANNKAIVEVVSEGIQLNGNPYNNRYVWILFFSDAGKIIEIREYLDTALCQEVMQTNP
ncbi:ketosteroid isomerase [Favolaschia claudopus]|uniref:Ketosteroid isomerase n=1 Tax=Favolaschia claudopus TaxID=2862362 RepID=A0AAW0CT76_9AGAR